MAIWLRLILGEITPKISPRLPARHSPGRAFGAKDRVGWIGVAMVDQTSDPSSYLAAAVKGIEDDVLVFSTCTVASPAHAEELLTIVEPRARPLRKLRARSSDLL